MAEVALVDEHPNGCTVCMAVAGPFVVYRLAGYTVNTVEGPFQVDGELALCAPRDGREGCVGQAARQIGYLPAVEVDHLREQVQAITESHAELEVRNGELEAKQALDRRQLAEEIAETIIAKAG